MPASLICSLIEVDPAHRAEFLDFHNREHIPERLSVAGFRSGRRFVSAEDGNRFLIVYEVDALAVLTSAAYLERLNDPTDWTRRCMAYVRGSDRMAIELELDLSLGHGGHAALFQMPAEAPAHIAAMPGIVAVRAGHVSPEASDIDTVERRGLAAATHARDAVMLIEASDAGALQMKMAPATKADATYRLQFSLTDRQAR